MFYDAIYRNVQRIFVFVTLPLRRHRLRQLLNKGFPVKMLPAADLLLGKIVDEAAKQVADYAEQQRLVIAKKNHLTAQVWYSPKPGSADLATLRPQPGKVLNYSASKAAFIGKNRLWATVLHLISREYQAKYAIELGTCVGISAIYLAKQSFMQQLVTVEGSSSLAELAVETLAELPQVVVLNMMFDDAIDRLLNGPQTIDLAYIDGHHEKIATIHYFKRLQPLFSEGAVVIFDDISWSSDMREAWEELSRNSAFSDVIDFGAIGVCIIKSSSTLTESKPKYWDLQPIVGRYPIGKPHGWKH